MKYPFVLIDWCRLACCLLLILWMPARATAQETQRRMMAHGGIERSYELRLPPGESRSPRPLVLSLHGLSRSPDPLIGHRAWLPMDSIADREGFVIVHRASRGLLQRLRGPQTKPPFKMASAQLRLPRLRSSSVCGT